MAGSLLHAAGLPELVTHSPADYEAKALDLVRQPQELSMLRQQFREKRTASLFDTQRFCRGLESAYDTMWRRQENGERPASFAVARDSPR